MQAFKQRYRSVSIFENISSERGLLHMDGSSNGRADVFGLHVQSGRGIQSHTVRGSAAGVLIADDSQSSFPPKVRIFVLADSTKEKLVSRKSLSPCPFCE